MKKITKNKMVISYILLIFSFMSYIDEPFLTISKVCQVSLLEMFLSVMFQEMTALKPLSPNINIHILLTIFNIFLM